MSTRAIEEAAAILRDARRAVALTGAGISVESGIPDFRSQDGLWSRYPPDEYATIDAYMANPDKVWRLWHELGHDLQNVNPNRAHFALALLESAGPLQGVITQNIDNLHQRAGSSRVIEYHGNAFHLTCLHCGKRSPLDLTLVAERAPRCGCGPDSLMKPDVVLFGEMIPEDAALEAEHLARNCDVMLVVGTSASVYPCASLPFLAKQNRALIIECNLEPTEYTTRITDCFLQGAAGTLLPLVCENAGFKE